MIVSSELTNYPVVGDAQQFGCDRMRGNHHCIAEDNRRTSSKEEQDCLSDARNQNRTIGECTQEWVNAWCEAPLAERPPWRPRDPGPDAVLGAVRGQISLLRVNGHHIVVRL